MKLIFRFFILIVLLAVAAGIFLAVRRFFASEEPAANFTFPYVQNFDDVNLRPWYVNDGVWTIRDQALLQTVGGEKPGQIHIPFNLPEDQPYHLSTYITLKRDTKAAGVSFNAQLPELAQQQHRVYLSRPNEEKFELVAGYMDEIGSFVPQAQVPLPLDLNEFRLDLFVYDNSYLVQLNGQRLIDRRPLFYKNGLTGFYSIGSVIFDSLKITAADRVNPGDLVYVSDFDQEPGGAGWVPFNGEWHVSEGQMAQKDPALYDTGIGYESSTFENYVVQTNLEHHEGAGAGLFFNMPSPYQINGAHVVRYSDETDALIWGYYDAQGVLIRQGFAESIPPGDQPHLLQVFSGDNSYDVFLDNSLVARDVPLQKRQGHIGLTTSRSAAGFSLVEVFPLFSSNAVGEQQLTPVAEVAESETATQETPTTTSPVESPTQVETAATPLAINSAIVADGGAAPYKGVFTGDFQSSGWRVITGDWRFENGSLVQADPNGFDYSVVNTSQAYHNYSVQSRLNHLQGFGGGVLFNMPFADRLNGAHLVRYTERRPGAIFWGYYDDTGRFVGQGYADVPEAGSDPHIFRVVSGESTYDIYLDATLIASGLALQQNQGYIGLLTSQSAVAYSEVIIDAADAVPVADSGIAASDGFNNVSVLSGRWITEDNRTIQEVTEEGDYILNLGNFASEYTIEAKITLPEASNAGAGFIFHMPDPGSRRGAQIARLINGGSGVFWGSFDDASAFQGKGSVAFSQPGTTFLLRLQVAGDLVDIWVNDTLVLESLPLNRRDGWLGLITFGGPVTYEDLKVLIVE
ncbi:MAG: hypothetical protein JSV68_10415 [Anaerolineaceae bacterium]|nr:MAG: hypothetical protein JSV68_10415 [Anaerolineaceae bacterium]